MDLIEGRIFAFVPVFYRFARRLETSVWCSRFISFFPALVLLVNVFVYFYLKRLDGQPYLGTARSFLGITTPPAVSHETVEPYSPYDDERSCSNEGATSGFCDGGSSEEPVLGGESGNNLYDVLSGIPEIDEVELMFSEDEYEDLALEEDNHVNEYLTLVESTRNNDKYSSFIGKYKELKPGTLLVNIDFSDSPQKHTLVVITKHGGRKNTIGYVLNDKLNDEESEKAREMLRESTEDYAESVNDDEEENDHIYQERFPSPGARLRSEQVRSMIHTGEKTPHEHIVWLGVGGSDRDMEESWTHFHSCHTVDDGDLLDEETGFTCGGDIFKVLQEFHMDRCRLKIVYGFTAWAPGQLDMELENSRWRIVNGVPTDVLFSETENKTKAWLDALVFLNNGL